MRINLLSLSLFLCFLASGLSGSERAVPPQAVAGVLDLTSWNLTDNGSIQLKGEWEFYWEKLLTEADFISTVKPEKTGFVTLPGDWNGETVGGKKLGGTGFATYRLRIELDDSGTKLAFKPGAILTAYRFYINGELLSERGIVGETRESGAPLLLSDTIVYSGYERSLNVIIQISNFNHRQGGPWDKIQMGTYDAITRGDRTTRDVDFFILGAILVMGIFYFSMYLLRKNESSYLYFSLFCLIIAWRTTVQAGAGYLKQAIPVLSWETLNKMEYITIYLALPFFLLFIISFFKDRYLVVTFKAVTAVSAVFTVCTLVTTSILHSWLIPVYQIVLLVSGLHILALIVYKSVKKDIFARILLLAFLLLFSTVINDILNANGIIKSFYMISYGLLLFIMFQAYVLTVRFIEVFNSVDRQKKELLQTNRAFKDEIVMRLDIENNLKASNENLLLAKSAIILGLAKIAEYRDSDTGFHLARIQEYNRILALELCKHPSYSGYISVEYINDLYESSILHDIGKVGVSDSILLKPGKLTSEEFEMIKKHPTIGGDTIKSIEKNIHAQTFLTLGREIAYMHHEKWDGSGYPNGTYGQNIPLSARITALTDVYDALTTKRCYKDAFTHEKAVSIITSERGTHFDPDIVDAFLKVEPEFERMRATLQDGAAEGI